MEEPKVVLWRFHWKQCLHHTGCLHKALYESIDLTNISHESREISNLSIGSYETVFVITVCKLTQLVGYMSPDLQKPKTTWDQSDAQLRVWEMIQV
jgi:hypothetical protein